MSWYQSQQNLDNGNCRSFTLWMTTFHYTGPFYKCVPPRCSTPVADNRDNQTQCWPSLFHCPAAVCISHPIINTPLIDVHRYCQQALHQSHVRTNYNLIPVQNGYQVTWLAAVKILPECNCILPATNTHLSRASGLLNKALASTV